MAERVSTPRTVLAVGCISATCAVLLATTHALTRDRIHANQQQHELRQITSLAGFIPPAHTSWVDDIWKLCNGSVLARERSMGYGGPMKLVMVIGRGGASGPLLQGLRVIQHQETPGLADFLQIDPDRQRSEGGWLASLGGRNAEQLARVDTVAGATISSQAVVRGVLDGFDHAAAAGWTCGP